MTIARNTAKATTGQRDTRITVASVQSVPDGFGGFTTVEQTELTAWARVRRLWGTEGIVSGALAGRQTVEIYLPASDAARQIEPRWIVTDSRSGKRFNIRDAYQSDDRREVVLLCESGVPA